jgi:predicted enzyme related to lactoylglutathione lyase
MDPYTTPGAFSWSELTTTDPAQAAAFYGSLFGWTFKDMGDAMGHYQVASLGDTQVAGIMSPPPGAPPMRPSWGCYVTVSQVEGTVQRCLELGGKVLVPAMDVPGVGRMAVIQDPQGATLSVMQYSAG